MFRSSDYGVTWASTNSTHLPLSSFSTYGDGQHIYAACPYSNNGLYKSSDYGATFINVINEAVKSVSVADSGRVIAYTSGYTGAWIYISRDYGVTWRKSVQGGASFVLISELIV